MPESNGKGLVERLPDLIDRYWDIAYAEGNEGRTTDTPNGDAQDTRHAIDAALEAQSAQTAELQAEVAHWKEAATRHHPNPADYRYWEGRYRDEAAAVAGLKRALDTARHDAMEEAGDLADRMLKQAGAAGLGSVPGWAVTAEHCISTIEASWAIPAAIRALSTSPLSQGGQE